MESNIYAIFVDQRTSEVGIIFTANGFVTTQIYFTKEKAMEFINEFTEKVKELGTKNE